jgi:hypothetical protein
MDGHLTKIQGGKKGQIRSMIVIGSLVMLFLLTTIPFHALPLKAQKRTRKGDSGLRLTDEKRSPKP